MSFRERFNKLFDLWLYKEVYVYDMNQLGWGMGGKAWKWRQRLFAWERELVGELYLLLQNVTL